MTSEDQNNVIEKVLIGTATKEEQALFDQWMATDSVFEETFEFRRTLAAQLRLKSQSELKHKFKQLRSESEKQPDPVKFNSIWKRGWFIAAASLVILILGFQLSRSLILSKVNKTVSLKGKNVETDSLHRIASQQEIDSIAVKTTPKIALDQQIRELPLFETDDSSLGFGKNEKPTNDLTVVFLPGTSRQYEFKDTLKIYLPKSEWQQSWQLIYDRTRDHYILNGRSKRYKIINGLEGRHALKKL
ncbi:hypothetical protein [Dyadobacter sp. 32]|uniref:hypothetical protein n=1 Tax=Dyadobacter sp. 32 TaxID=538966 RepID=UPI0011EDC3A6